MSSADKLRELINDTNLPPKNLTERNTSFSVPEVFDDGEHNTKVTVAGNAGRGYYGSVDVTYNRINLSDYDYVKAVRSADPLTQELVLELINSTYNLFLTMDDVETFEVPELAEGETAQLTINAKNQSLGVMGSILVGLEFGRSWLDSVIAVKVLGVQKHPITVSTLKSARMLTWALDFTSVRDALVVLKGTYTDFAAVQAAASAYGVPAWTQGTIVDKATSEVADANPAFHRVVIQQTAPSAEMSGPVYLHYNVLEEMG